MTSLGHFDRADTADSFEPWERDERKAAIDEEIARLPVRYRLPVVLCYVEGLTHQQAARRLRCPIGTIECQLHRAHERLRTTLTRRGFAPTAGFIAELAAATARGDVPPSLALRTAALAARVTAGGSLAETVSASVALLVRQNMRMMMMNNGLCTGLVLLAVTVAVAGTSILAAAGGQQPRVAAAADLAPQVDLKEPTAQRSLAERFKQIRAEYEAAQDRLSKAIANVKTQREINQTFREMAPDEVAFCRRMLDLAASAPGDSVSRDALIWVVYKPGMFDHGDFGDEFARAAELLVRHHGDDPEAVSIGLELDNMVSHHRDALLMGFYAAAKGHEAKGLASLALAQYLEEEAKFAAAARMKEGRQKNRYLGMIDADGKRSKTEVEVEQSEEAEARLDNMHNVVPGKPAPEIDGFDLD